MFEGKPPISAHAPSSAHDVFADEELSAFSWGDLVARLSAAQELRAVLAQVPATARASFDALAAEHLAKRGTYALSSGKLAVNLDPSGNGKGGGAIDSSSAGSAWPPVRGIA